MINNLVTSQKQKSYNFTITQTDYPVMNFIKNIDDLLTKLADWFGESGSPTVHVEYVDRTQWDRLYVMLHHKENALIGEVTIELCTSQGTAIFIILEP